MIPKEEQPTRYYYKVLKDNKTYDYSAGELVETTEEYKEKYENENFAFAFKFRPAFIGDMQAKFDKAYGFSNKENFIDSFMRSKNHPFIRYVKQPVYIRINIFQWLWMKVKETIIEYKIKRWSKKNQKLNSDFIDMIYNYNENDYI